MLPMAIPTAFQLNGNTVNVASDKSAIYVTRPDGVTEQWSRLLPEPLCAG